MSLITAEAANSTKTRRDQLRLAKLYQAPLNAEGKPGTGKDELELLYDRTGDEIFAKIVELRSLDTNLNNYLPNWLPNSRTGRVHTTFSYGPSSGQLASSRPNVLNCSKHTEIGQEFRKIVVAPPGYTFVEFDYQRFHVHTLAFLAECPEYMRFARLDSHTIFTGFVVEDGKRAVDWEWSDEDIRLACKALRKDWEHERNYKFKPIVLGNQLGLGPRKLYRMNRKHIEGEKEARDLQSIIAERFPVPHAWKSMVQQEAHDKGYQMNPWGYIDYYFNVFQFRYNKKNGCWDKTLGDDAQRAIAFPVQSYAFGMIKEKILEFAERGYDEEFGFVNSVHDNVQFCCEIGKRDKCIEEVGKIMGEPCLKLTNRVAPEGLQVGTDVSIGRNWQKKSEKNPEGLEEV